MFQKGEYQYFSELVLYIRTHQLIQTKIGNWYGIKKDLVSVVFFLNLFYVGSSDNAAEYGSQLSIIHGKQNYIFPNILLLDNIVQLLSI